MENKEKVLAVGEVITFLGGALHCVQFEVFYSDNTKEKYELRAVFKTKEEAQEALNKKLDSINKQEEK